MCLYPVVLIGKYKTICQIHQANALLWENQRGKDLDPVMKTPILHLRLEVVPEVYSEREV